MSDKAKVMRFTAACNFPRQVDWFALLARSASQSTITLPVPETLISHHGEYSFISSDSKRKVSVVTSSDSLTLFLSTCSSLANAKASAAARFPKFIVFGTNCAKYTVKKESDLRLCVNEPSVRIQRYIVPRDLTVQKTVIRWRRLEGAKVYIVKSTLPIKPKREPIVPPSVRTLGLELEFIASLSALDTCEVTHQKLACAEVESILSSLLSLLEESVLSETECVEEFYASVMQGLDGHWYFLNASGVSVSRKVPAVLRRATMSHIEEVLQTEVSPKSQGRRATLNGSVPQSSPVDEAVASLARFERLSQARRAAAADSASLCRLSAAPDFLESCVSQLLSRARLHQTLQHFFVRMEDHAIVQMTAGVCRFIREQRSGYSLRLRHKALHISEGEYQCFCRLFLATVSDKGGSREGVEALGRFLEGLADGIVAPRESDCSDK